MQRFVRPPPPWDNACSLGPIDHKLPLRVTRDRLYVSALHFKFLRLSHFEKIEGRERTDEGTDEQKGEAHPPNDRNISK